MPHVKMCNFMKKAKHDLFSVWSQSGFDRKFGIFWGIIVIDTWWKQLYVDLYFSIMAFPSVKWIFISHNYAFVSR